MFKIGEFSKLVRVSPRMLRHYEKCGLLYPALIDPFTGYRQYSAGQIPLLANIVTLRDVGFSIDEICDILPHFDEPVYLDKVFRAKATSVKATLEAEQEKYDRLIQLSDTIRKERNIMVYDIELKSLPAVKVLALREIIPHYNQESILWEKLGGYIGQNGIVCSENGGYSVYHDEDYKETDVDVEIAIPVVSLGKNSDENDGFVYKELEAISQAATVRFSGPDDGGYDAAIEKLASWVEENGYAISGLIRGYAIMSGTDKENPESFLTELQVPVELK